MKAIIAEKPSVAKDIAKIVGANAHKDGYMEGNGYRVTWAFGHLVELAMPEDYGWEGFKAENLPMIPDTFKLQPRQKREGRKMVKDAGVLKQLKVIKEVFSAADEIIVATDAGREGELIFRYIYAHLKCKTPFRRLWISSLTDKAIRDGLANVRPGHDYDNLYVSAECRSQADWLVGINASQALCVKAGGNFSLGRVQTPTLRIICERYLEHKHFVPQKYWQLKVETEKSGMVLSMLSETHYDSLDQASESLAAVQAAGSLKVESVAKKEVRQEPPLLYDLTTLQKDANSRLGFSADKTLSIAQSLYEKKVMSYPRTGSRYISEDVFEIIPDRLRILSTYEPVAAAARSLTRKKLCRKSVDDGKVTDHHALIATENLPDELAADERKIYDMVVMRMVEAFGETCVKDATTVKMMAGGENFILKGSVIRYLGWRAVRGIETEEEEEAEGGTLPPLSDGDMLPIREATTVEKQTKPKPLHTESSLLAAMETAGKDIDDEEVRASMKESGIGTPATRAAIIETLFKREYIERQKKSLVPTAKGLAVYDIVKGMLISDVAMTGRWEAALNRIADGQGKAEAFKGAIMQYTRQITSELLALQEVGRLGGQRKETPKIGICPLCGGEIVAFPKLAKCTNQECNFKLWREVSGKKLADKDLSALLSKGKTGKIKGFKGKSGKSFEASLELKDGKISFVFAK